jgi:antitoxin (DNA-binding transcriptional repressor) of toxin-antitoxin stability system
MTAIRDAILRLAAARGPDKSICPSEVARDLAETWRPLMGPVRAEAVALAREGRLVILRHGRPVADLDALRGVIRLRIAPGEEARPEALPPDPVTRERASHDGG